MKNPKHPKLKTKLRLLHEICRWKQFVVCLEFLLSALNNGKRINDPEKKLFIAV
jgi:hypothetical protein